MIRFLQAWANFIGSLILILIFGFVAYGLWGLYQHVMQRVNLEKEVGQLREELKIQSEENKALRSKNQELMREVERLRLANRLLKVDTRLAILDVLRQEGSPTEQNLRTTVVFQEVDSTGRPIAPRHQFTIDGDVLYIDAWVAKFQDQFVELGDEFRGGSICLFRRLFGENQKPSEGLVLDLEGDSPGAYREGREVSEFEREIWANFWKLANDPAQAEKRGLRAVHGEAVYMKLVPGTRYRIQLRSSDGLTILPEGEVISIGERAG